MRTRSKDVDPSTVVGPGGEVIILVDGAGNNGGGLKTSGGGASSIHFMVTTGAYDAETGFVEPLDGPGYGSTKTQYRLAHQDHTVIAKCCEVVDDIASRSLDIGCNRILVQVLRDNLNMKNIGKLARTAALISTSHEKRSYWTH